MTVSSTTTKNSYSGNGSTTTFAYGFKIFADADLTVILRSSTGVETVQSLTTHYTVTNAGNASGGNVVFGSAPASGVTVVIRRNMALTQSTDYVANDPFPAATHEDALDRLTFISQQMQEEVDRSIKLSRTNTMTSTEFTTSATDRASKVLAFDSSGELSVTQELGTFKGSDATVTTAAYVERDIIKSTTTAELNNVYICVAASVVGDSLTDTDHFALLVDAVSAASSATTATTKASEAATSATNAANSASTASTQASNASTSASTASTQATNAANSATAAASSAASAATALDNFDDIFLGAKSSDPSTDNDGDALNAGDLYFNTTSNQLKVFNGSSFQTIDTFTTGISSGNVPVFTSGIADDDFLRVNGTSIEGRSASEVLSDIGASPVAGSSSIVTTGALDSGSITSGFGNIDVGSSTITTTGAITGGSLVIDNITIDGTEIDLSSGDITLDAALDIKLDAAGGDIKFLSDGTEFGEIRNISNDLTVISSVADKDIVFKGQDSSSEIEAMRIDMSSGGFVGIGTSSPDAPITIQPTAQGIGTNSVQNWMYSLSSGSEFDLKLNQIVSSGLVKHSFTLRNNGTSYSDNLVLDRGNVGIGTSSPSDLLEIQGGSADGIRISVSGQSYHHKIRTNGDGLLLSADDSGAGGAGADMRFHVAGAERVRIENDGDVLIGKTTTSILTAGIAMSNTLGIRPIVDGDVAMLAGRLSSDGEIIQFRKENTKIGRIGVASGTLFIGSAESNLRFNFGAGQAVIPATSAGASRDNVIDLGESSARFNDAFITNGVTTGSDKNEKQDIEELSEAEKKVALACKGLMRKFRWKDAVAEKGDKARTHFGIIAQDLEDAFKAEGLDASKYAMFCSDTWTNDDGKEQTRLGIRYPQLLAFIISAI